MEFGESDPAKMAEIDAAIEQHKSEIERMAERALTMPILTDTDAYTKAINEHKQAIGDLRWERRELQERPTREQLIERIERAEKACTEGKQREYNEFLKTVIQKIVVYSRRFAEGRHTPTIASTSCWGLPSFRSILRLFVSRIGFKSWMLYTTKSASFLACDMRSCPVPILRLPRTMLRWSNLRR